ncbi:error-prone DNA polymerase [mine drainage metagenome]|uniref:Error-prone DNA polymerase n=1 Tax=mine drainage metagenome TaxID=410659 RepID=A0A1J5TWS4_9ZZZZ
MPPYAELHCLSNFTFLRGASHAEELVERARELNYAALAITDECSLAGVVRAHMAAKKCGLKLIVGSEIRFADGPSIVLLATDRTGYGNLSELISQGRRNAIKGRYSLALSDIQNGLPGCLALLLPDPMPTLEQAQQVATIFPGRSWLAVELFRAADDAERLSRLIELGAVASLPLVAAGDVHMHVAQRRALQDTLTAIRLCVPVFEAGTELYPNGERHLRELADLARIYQPELLEQTLVVAERCHFSLDELRYEYPEELVPAGETAISYLRKLTEEGLLLRFPDGVPDKARTLVEYELALIEELKYEPYFLTVHDIVRFARIRGILCQGRGSAANSAVCYALHITEVNPACMEMLFERFISKERNEPPDIDVDFEHERREEVIQYLYAKYGRERAALAATVITYKPKSAMRDIGKALGFDLEQVDRLSKSLAWWDGRQVLPQRLEEAGFDPENRKVRLLMQLLDELIGFPRHLSQHVGGFVIARGKLSQLVPIENAAMAERTIIQWDKDDLDALGLLKVDVLALGMLSAIRRALDEVGRLRGRAITMADIPREDPAVYEMIGHADTVGVFQIESRAQMSMLPRMRPRNFYDLVIEVAIVRPGPIQGGMVHPYLRRREGSEPVTYPSEEVRDVLQRTLGVPIFQEQVMRLTVVAAGFSPGEADEVRRSMAAWKRKGGLEHLEQRLIDGMSARGYRQEFALQIFQQILGFGEYGFPESHAASFALLVYISAWLKCHEPAAFACALLNSQPMGFYAPTQLVQDARRHGVEVLPADVTESEWDCTLAAYPSPQPSSLRGEGGVSQPALRLGLRMVNGLSLEGAARLSEARSQKPFDSVEDMARRAGLESRDLKCLAAAGALSTLAGHRRQAYWDVAGIEQVTPLALATVEETQPQLLPLTEGQNLVADYDSLGLTLGRHPLALLRDTLRAQRLITAAELRTFPHGRLTRAAGLVIGRQRPGTASGVTFVTLEDETGPINVVVWRDLGERQRRELLGSRLLAVYGVLERQGEVVHLIAGHLKDLTPLLGDLVTQSRDFH